MSRHQLEKLRENRAIVGHGLNIIVFDWYSTNQILHQGAFRPLLFSPLLWDSNETHSTTSPIGPLELKMAMQL